MQVTSSKLLLAAALTGSVLALSISFTPSVTAGETLIADSGAGRGFHSREIEIIRDYFFEAEEYERGGKKGHKNKKFKHKNNKHADNHGRYMSAKMKKRKGLPPGIMKQIREGKRIPADVEMYDIPDYLQRRLPLPPRGTRRVVVDNDILLIRQGTNLVLDIIENVLSRQ